MGLRPNLRDVFHVTEPADAWLPRPGCQFRSVDGSWIGGVYIAGYQQVHCAAAAVQQSDRDDKGTYSLVLEKSPNKGDGRRPGGFVHRTQPLNVHSRAWNDSDVVGGDAKG